MSAPGMGLITPNGMGGSRGENTYMNFSILIFLAQTFPKVEKDGTGITPANAGDNQRNS